MDKTNNFSLRDSSAECTLYLKRNGDFPLDKPCKIALYGSGIRYTLKGGTGSGDVNLKSFTTIEESFKQAGFTITTNDWLNAYDDIRKKAKQDFIKDIKARAKANHTMAVMEGMGAVMPEPEYKLPLDVKCDVAVYVLSRISGEGNDRKVKAGDILLSETEKNDILNLQENYSKFLLVLNVGGVVDLSPILNIDNILYLGQLGSETSNILVDIILGKSYPSGKLTTTWSAYKDYCDIGEFGNINDTSYKEGIYVGYRYFDTVNKKALFPFGYGLGNTDFSIKETDFNVKNSEVEIKATILNIGNYLGKEVVELYVSCPSGKLDKPYQVLAAFNKTRELKPNQSEELTLKFSLEDVASYDVSKQAWVLEKGNYILRLGTSSVNTKEIGTIKLNDDIITKQVKKCFGEVDFKDYVPNSLDIKSIKRLKEITIDSNVFKTEKINYTKEYPIDEIVDKLSNEDLATLSVGKFNKSAGALSIIGNAASSVAGAAGETSNILVDKGFPKIIMADGPAGLRLSKDYSVDQNGEIRPIGVTMPDGIIDFLPSIAKWFMKKSGSKVKKGAIIKHQYCTAIPIGTAIAQSWNLDFAKGCGDLVGKEMEEFKVDLWLAPALNIHRDIRCGRNFEYYSEDPLISGKFAAAITNGVQSHKGKGTVIKHFAANNQETNRYTNNSKVSERALREIYLKGFEIAIKESQPLALMTSYNLINGAHTSERRDLLEDVLRCEFNYKGVVMTDWIIPSIAQMKNYKYEGPKTDKNVMAGNDLTMPGTVNDYNVICKALKEGTLSLKQIKINVTRICNLSKELNK